MKIKENCYEFHNNSFKKLFPVIVKAPCGTIIYSILMVLLLVICPQSYYYKL